MTAPFAAGAALRHRGAWRLGVLSFLAAAACDDASSVRVVSDVAFVDVLGTGDASSDAAIGPMGCSLDQASCSGARCCGDGQRCVPSAAGPSVCVAAGTLIDGAPCDPVADGCAAGSLCAAEAEDALTWTCRSLCATALDCEGRDCDEAWTLGGEVLRLCAAPAR